ncbi:SpoIIE family protein phosphatase [Streptomyces sp. B-S-A8]|uniref:SpoIIE family protein phosphatase n=1 Tax=Streptomyces solicavernae TaxID=3043614 RepID=A0ABT6RVG1_9ACTN|nr:SpoIIE family protein phosphatase [Streptomyces sp. B-S-A8]MDI3388427.1 SpoIIE family protein phosphatase [Streptomyces sp. B-S-A8]
MGKHGSEPRTSSPPPRPSGQHERQGRPAGRRRARLNARSVAGQVFLLQLGIVVILVVATLLVIVVQVRNQAADQARDEVLVAGEAFANGPGTAAALDGPDPTAVLQPRAEAARKRSGLDAVVVTDTKGLRLTHPDPEQIGKPFVGTIGPALEGRTIVESAQGPVLPGGETDVVQSVVPVLRADGSVAGIVSVSVTVKHVNRDVAHRLPVLLATAGGALLVAAGGAALVSRRLKRQTHGLGPVEMTRMYEHHDAVLHSVREGVLIVGADGRLLLANDEARRLLDLPADAERRQIAELGLAPAAARLLASGESVTDAVHLVGDRLLAVNVRPVDRHGGPAGSVATLRDSTELRALAGRAELARERLQLLYDAGVGIGTTLDVARTAEELTEIAVPRFADFATVELLDAVTRGDEPDDTDAAGDAAMHRIAVRGVQADPPLYPAGSSLHFVTGSPMAEGLATGHAVLAADLHASEGWRAQDPERARRVLEHGIHSLISVPLRARGVVLGSVNYWRSEQEPFTEDDVSFAEELSARAALSVDNARRYAREHAVAVTLQRSLLPRALPEQTALDVAHRYLPAEAGVGGDWFDVLPLPGARVALVVGDVVGHGLHAAATMGRLRTAVHNFSALDRGPDELIGHLDELVARIDADEADPEAAGEGMITGATCLYAIYDPVTGRCTLARAGHPGPAVVHPDGTAEFPDVPVSPPLGLGAGLPVETAELHLPEGSTLALYTDGLVEDRHRDLEVGLGLLRAALAETADRSPDEVCRAVLDTVLPERPGDDVALLVARTRRLVPDRVAEWDVPADPAAVSRVRADVTRKLADWDLDEAAFATELVVSELVTNAIRYGTDPIRLRLLHDRNSLICEVSDGSSTSPHLRRAKSTDEGGRGLFLVARFAERWGTRYTGRGKVIWTEQSLHHGSRTPEAESEESLLDQWGDDGEF